MIKHRVGDHVTFRYKKYRGGFNTGIISAIHNDGKRNYYSIAMRDIGEISGTNRIGWYTKYERCFYSYEILSDNNQHYYNEDNYYLEVSLIMADIESHIKSFKKKKLACKVSISPFLRSVIYRINPKILNMRSIELESNNSFNFLMYKVEAI